MYVFANIRSKLSIASFHLMFSFRNRFQLRFFDNKSVCLTTHVPIMKPKSSNIQMFSPTRK